MTRATWLAATVLALVIAYGVAATALWANNRSPDLAERHRLKFCSAFSDILDEHRRDVEAQFHWDDTIRKLYITYLSRDSRIIIDVTRLCLPTITFGERDPGDWIGFKFGDAITQESALEDYLLAVDVLALLLDRDQAEGPP